MTTRLWQAADSNRFRIDDSHNSRRQLEVRPSNGVASVVLDVVGIVDDDGGIVDAAICVGMLDLLAALQGVGVDEHMVRGVWGIPAATIDRPRAVADHPQA